MRFHSLTVTSTAFLNIEACRLVEVDQCYRGVYCLLHQGDIPEAVIFKINLVSLTFINVEMARERKY